MSAQIDSHLFAQLVGRYPDPDLLLFQVSPLAAEQFLTGEWSEPVQLCFTRDEGALAQIHVRYIGDAVDVLARIAEEALNPDGRARAREDLQAARETGR